MSTLTDAIDVLKDHAALKAIIDERVYTRLPRNLDDAVPFVRLIGPVGGPPFQDGDGHVVATMERWRVVCWAHDESELDTMVVPVQDALLTLWGQYEVSFVGDPRGDIDPTTGLAWRYQDVRFIGCV